MEGHPQASLAVFMREVECRMLSVVTAALCGKDPTASYAAARKGQALTILEQRTHPLKEEPQQKKLPF